MVTERLAGKKQLVSFDVGGDVPDAQLVLQFGNKDNPMRREIEIKDLRNGGPKKRPGGSAAKGIAFQSDSVAGRPSPLNIWR